MNFQSVYQHHHLRSVVQGRKGRVLHTHQSFFAFLHNRDIAENGGVFVTRARSLISLAPKGNLAPKLGDLSKMNPAMSGGAAGGMVGSGNIGRGPRDRLIGVTVVIIKGPRKGYVGHIKDTNGNIARVELLTGNKVITIDKEKLKRRGLVIWCVFPDCFSDDIVDQMVNCTISKDRVRWLRLMVIVGGAVVNHEQQTRIIKTMVIGNQAGGVPLRDGRLILMLQMRVVLQHGTPPVALQHGMHLDEHLRGMPLGVLRTRIRRVARHPPGMPLLVRLIPMLRMVAGHLHGQPPPAHLILTLARAVVVIQAGGTLLLLVILVGHPLHEQQELQRVPGVVQLLGGQTLDGAIQIVLRRIAPQRAG